MTYRASNKFPRQHFKVPANIVGKIALWVLRRYLGPRYYLRLKGRTWNLRKCRKAGVQRRHDTQSIPLGLATYWGVYLEVKPVARRADANLTMRMERRNEIARLLWAREQQGATG